MAADAAGLDAALRRFYAILSSGDADALPSVVTAELEEFVGIGLDGDVEDGVVWLDGFRADLVEDDPIERVPGPEPRCHVHGDVGWFADRPTLRLPDGSSLRPRLTGVMRREDGAWRLVSLHASLSADDGDADGDE